MKISALSKERIKSGGSGLLNVNRISHICLCKPLLKYSIFMFLINAFFLILFIFVTLRLFYLFYYMRRVGTDLLPGDQLEFSNVFEYGNLSFVVKSCSIHSDAVFYDILKKAGLMFLAGLILIVLHDEILSFIALAALALFALYFLFQLSSKKWIEYDFDALSSVPVSLLSKKSLVGIQPQRFLAEFEEAIDDEMCLTLFPISFGSLPLSRKELEDPMSVEEARNDNRDLDPGEKPSVALGFKYLKHRFVLEDYDTAYTVGTDSRFRYWDFNCTSFGFSSNPVISARIRIVEDVKTRKISAYFCQILKMRNVKICKNSNVDEIRSKLNGAA